MYKIKGIFKYLISKLKEGLHSSKGPSVLLQLGCPLVSHLFVLGALMDNVLNLQGNHEIFLRIFATVEK
jgi:hypothetical protein